jgi:DNA invertase Pin-like site-specific DNA recombinase
MATGVRRWRDPYGCRRPYKAIGRVRRVPDRDLAAIGRRLARSRATTERLIQEAKEAAIEAHDEGRGTSESEIARLLQVNRHTVREWLGKRRR